MQYAISIDARNYRKVQEAPAWSINEDTLNS